jgi:hypothetical protein
MSKNNKLTTKENDKKLDLNRMHELDLSKLDDSQKNHILTKLTESQVDLAKTAQQAQIDIGATKTTLNDMTDSVRKATTDGTSATITHAQTTSIGRTEIVMGNTERAAKGKISRSGTGLDNNLMKIVIIAGVFAVITALIISN